MLKFSIFFFSRELSEITVSAAEFHTGSIPALGMDYKESKLALNLWLG